MVDYHYIKRGNKLYGPYYYRSYRVGDKVKKEYLGKKPQEPSFRRLPSSQEKKPHTNLFPVLFLVSVLFLGVVLLGNLQYTGKIAMQISSDNLEVNQTISGNFNLMLKEGEFIPKDSVVQVKIANKSQSILLSDFIALSNAQIEQQESDFYTENASLEGRGQGYGWQGKKVVYPEVFFSLRITQDKAKEKNEALLSENETTFLENATSESNLSFSETPISEQDIADSVKEEIISELNLNPPQQTEEQNATLTANTTETTEQQVSQITGMVASSIQTSEPNFLNKITRFFFKKQVNGKDAIISRITGLVSSDLRDEIIDTANLTKEEINGIDKKVEEKVTEKVDEEINNKKEIIIEGNADYLTAFAYPLKKQTAELVSGSVHTSQENLSDDKVSLALSAEEVRVTTDYYEELTGFGEEFSGKVHTITLNLTALGISVEEAGTYSLTISLEYANQTITDSSAEIQVKEPKKNNPPELIVEIPSININKNKTATINLADYFTDKDNDELTYSSSSPQNITITIDGSIATITPDLEFIGTRETLFFAYDGEETAISNIVKINVTTSNVPSPSRISIKNENNTNYLYGKDEPNTLLKINIIPEEKINVDEKDVRDYITSTSLEQGQEEVKLSNSLSTLAQSINSAPSDELKNLIEAKLDSWKSDYMQEGKTGYALLDICSVKNNDMLSIPFDYSIVDSGLELLRSTQKRDGSWNYGLKDTLISTNALIVCSAQNYSQEIRDSLNWVKKQQNKDGSWSGESERLQFSNTGLAMIALDSAYKKGIINSDAGIKEGQDWVIRKINSEQDIYYPSFGMVFLIYTGYNQDYIDNLAKIVQDKKDIAIKNEDIPVIQAIDWAFSLYSPKSKASTVEVMTNSSGDFSVEINEPYGEYTLSFSNYSEKIVLTPAI